MTNLYRAMCAELVDAVEQARQALEGWANYGQWVWPEIALEQAKRNTTEALALLNRARALLAQPVVEGPTDEELLASVRHLYGNQTAADIGAEDDLRTARAVLDKWGRPTPQPVAVSERLPGPEDCDEQGRCWLLTVEDEYPQWRLHAIEGAQPGGAMIWVPVDSSPGVMVDCFYTSHWLPANALPTPEATNG